MASKKAKTMLRVLLLLTAAFCVFCILAPLLEPNDPGLANLAAAKQAPSAQYPWGTDGLGRCVFSRVLDGAATSVFSALEIVALTLVIGSAVGILAGYFGGKCDEILMRVVDIFLAFPGMVLALAVAGVALFTLSGFWLIFVPAILMIRNARACELHDPRTAP